MVIKRDLLVLLSLEAACQQAKVKEPEITSEPLKETADQIKEELASKGFPLR